MPFIQAKTTVSITKAKEIVIKERIGKAIECIPGKSEGRLMLQLEDNVKMYFKGDDQLPSAFIQVMIYGKSTKSAFNDLTGELCRIMEEELNISPERIYVKYEEVEHWGCNGSNF